MLFWYSRAQSVPRKHPHTITAPPAAWTIIMIQGRMDIMPNSDPTIQMSQQNVETRHTRQPFSNLILFNFGEPVWTVALVLSS